MTRALYIDNQRVDLPEDVRFQLTFQIADFGELRPRGSGSNTIKLPKTPRNTAIFQNCNFVQVNSRFPYVVHSAYYYEDGWLVFSDATVYMLAITETDFEIQCVWGNSNTIRNLKALDMGDVAGLGNVNYKPAVYGYIETGIRNEHGIMTTFPLATAYNLKAPYTRGLLPVKTAIDNLIHPVYSPAVQSYLSALYAFPAFSKAKIIYGDSVLNGSITQDRNINPTIKTILDYSGGVATLSSDPILRKAAFIAFDNNNRTVRTQGGTPFDGIVAPFTKPGDWYDVEVTISNIMFQDPAQKTAPPFTADSRVTEAVFVLGQVLASNDNTKYTAASDSSLVINIDQYWNDKGKTYSGSKRIYIDNEEVDFGNGVKAIPQVYCALWPTTVSSGSLDNEAISCTVQAKITAVNELTETEINMPDERTAGIKSYITISMTDILRGLSAYDFITNAVKNSGAIFDVKDGQLRLFTYSDIINNGAEILDWSDKLIYIKDENTFNQSNGSLNEVKYKQTEYYNGYGNGAFVNPLAQKLGKGNKTLIENSLFGFNNGFYRTSANIPFVLEKTDKDGGVTYEYLDRGWNLVRLSNGRVTWLADKDGFILPERYAVNPINATQPTFADIKASAWNGYISLQERYRKAKALFMLSPQDVADLDFKKPIYLRQYAQAYIVTKVDYQPKASSVEMILIR